MPYSIKIAKRKKKKRYLIVRKTDGKVVGHSSSRAKAGASVGHRMRGEHYG